MMRLPSWGNVRLQDWFTLLLAKGLCEKAGHRALPGTQESRAFPFKSNLNERNPQSVHFRAGLTVASTWMAAGYRDACGGDTGRGSHTQACLHPCLARVRPNPTPTKAASGGHRCPWPPTTGVTRPHQGPAADPPTSLGDLGQCQPPGKRRPRMETLSYGKGKALVFSLTSLRPGAPGGCLPDPRTQSCDCPSVYDTQHPGAQGHDHHKPQKLQGGEACGRDRHTDGPVESCWWARCLCRTAEALMCSLGRSVPLLFSFF